MKEKFELSDLINELLIKSEEAYLMSIEIINKPTIKYRTEGFCFFICNAWELMLKAFLIRREKSIDAIMFKDKNRSISLTDCVNRVFTSTTDKTKVNLNFIINIRNKATHMIVPEFDYELSSFFQQNISNFNDFYKKQFPDNRLNNSVNAYVSINSLNVPESNALLLFDEASNLKKLIEESKDIEGMSQRVNLFVIKNKDEADMHVSLVKDSKEEVKMLKVEKDVNAIYIYTFKELIKKVNETLKLSLSDNVIFTSHSLNQINRDYNAKSKNQFTYRFDYGGGIVKYSEAYFLFIVTNFINNEDFRNKYKKKGG